MTGSPESKLQVRRLRFNLSKDFPRYWNANCPVKSHVLNAIAILAPAFERLAISSVIPFKDKIKNPQLAKAVQDFIGQESAHGSEFIRYNQCLKLQGYDTKKLEKANLKRFKSLAQKFSPIMHLSLTLAAEHLTAIISNILLSDPQWLENAHPSVCALWRWHALEEIEHKAVVFDLYQDIGGGYFSRIFGMWLVSMMLGGLLARNFLHLVYKDKLLFSISFWTKTFKIMLAKPGMIRKLLIPYLHYYIPYFHPWQQKHEAILNKWRGFFESTHSSENYVKMLKDQK